MFVKKLLPSMLLAAALVAAFLALRRDGSDIRSTGAVDQRAADRHAAQPTSRSFPRRGRLGGDAATARGSRDPGAATVAPGVAGEDPDVVFIRARLTDRHGSVEAGFLMRVAESAKDWSTLQATVAEHEALTGNDYRALLMKVGINARVIPAGELARMLDDGVMPPPEGAEQLVASSDSGLVGVFAERGLVPDLNAPNRSSGRDALGTLALNVSYAPARYDEQAIRKHVDTFVALGALPHQALLDVLETPNRSDIEHRIWLARALIDNGATLGPEHAALIQSIRAADVRRRLEVEFLEAGNR